LGPLNLAGPGPIYLDAVIIIYSLEGFPSRAAALGPMWSASASGQLKLVSSELSLMEVLVGPIKRGNPELRIRYERTLLESNVELFPISRPILREAACLWASMRWLRTPDAIHLATARCHACSGFLTNDKALLGVSGLPIVLLDDLMRV
jgi:predicted nucleic acid-binding protein